MAECWGACYCSICGSTVTSRGRGVCAEGSRGGGGSYEAGLVIVSTGWGYAGVPGHLCGAEAKLGPDVSLTAFLGTARPLAPTAHVFLLVLSSSETPSYLRSSLQSDIQY